MAPHAGVEQSEQRRCLAWMLQYVTCIFNPERALDNDESHELQDWSEAALPLVRVILRNRPKESPPDSQRLLAFDAAAGQNVE